MTLFLCRGALGGFQPHTRISLATGHTVSLKCICLEFSSSIPRDLADSAVLPTSSKSPLRSYAEKFMGS